MQKGKFNHADQHVYLHLLSSFCLTVLPKISGMCSGVPFGFLSLQSRFRIHRVTGFFKQLLSRFSSREAHFFLT